MEYSKTKNWQDVTLQELSGHWDMGIDELPNPLTFEVARYMNAYVLGDIHGGGVDVRCTYQKEAAKIYHDYINIVELRKALLDNGWKEGEINLSTYQFIKGDTKILLDSESNGDCGYMTVKYITNLPTEAYNIEYFYDNCVSKKETALKLLIKAEQYLRDENCVAKDFLNGKDVFTQIDAKYITKGYDFLVKAIGLLKEDC